MHRIAIFLVMVSAAVCAEAQLTIGAFGIVNRMGISGDAPPGGSWAPNFSFGGGLHVAYDVTSDVSIFLQGEFVGRSSALQYDVPIDPDALISKDTTVDSAIVNTQWIGIPIGMRVFSSNHRWFFSTGATLGLLQGVEIDTIGGSLEPENAIKNIDLQLFVGAGYLIPIDPIGIAIELRYNQGVIDLIGEEQNVAFRSEPVIRMSGFQARVSAEWRFDL